MSPLIQEVWCYLSILASVLSELQWLVQSLGEPPVLSLHCSKMLEACTSSKLLPFSLDFSLDAIVAVCYKPKCYQV